jgi:hypothetical protein
MVTKGIASDCDRTMLVKFSDGNFNEQVLCDVVEMDAFHVLTQKTMVV